MSEATPARKTAREMIIGYFKDFGVLRETGLEYWGIQIINFLDCTFYFAMLTIATVFLSEDLGLNDKQAGYTTAIFTSGLSGFWTWASPGPWHASQERPLCSCFVTF